jgi:hypothetical protein
MSPAYRKDIPNASYRDYSPNEINFTSLTRDHKGHRYSSARHLFQRRTHVTPVLGGRKNFIRTELSLRSRENFPHCFQVSKALARWEKEPVMVRVP